MRDIDRITGDTRCAEDKYREMFTNAPLAIFRTTFDGTFLDANPRLAALLGFESPDEVVEHYRDVGLEIYEDAALRNAVLENLRKEGRYSFEARFRDRYGLALDAEVHLRVVCANGGEPLYIEGLGADISQRKQAERSLRAYQKDLEESDRKYRMLFDAAGDAIFLFDANGLVHDVNRAACDMLGHEYKTLIGMAYSELNQPDYAMRFKEWLPGVLESNEPFAARTELIAVDGAAIPTELSARSIRLDSGLRVICIARDISARIESERALRRSREIIEQEVFERTAQLKRANERLQQEIERRAKNEDRIRVLAMYDALTGLPNRALIMDRLSHTTAWVQRTGGNAAILYLDLNNFKPINDKFGHEAGDDALKEVANRLSGCLRDVDTAGRIGGDEFVILLQNLSRREDVEIVVGRLLNSMREPITLGGQPYHDLGVSVGICFCPGNGSDVDTIIRRADHAMYEAKRMGNNVYQYWEGDVTSA